jgi:hypothetical protein
MLSTNVRHGDLVIDMETDGSVRITRQSNAMAIQLSSSEWIYIQRVAELHGWPVAPPTGTSVNTTQYSDTLPSGT